MIREEIKDNIFVNNDYFYWSEEDSYGYDQAYNSFPCVFPTVNILLDSTESLDSLADKERKNAGCIPLFDTSEEYDSNAWYEFQIHLNGFTNSHVDTAIYVEVQSLSEEDDMETFYIDLSAEEQEYIYQCLNEELDCEALLRKAADYWKDETGELTILERRPL